MLLKEIRKEIKIFKALFWLCTILGLISLILVFNKRWFAVLIYFICLAGVIGSAILIKLSELQYITREIQLEIRILIQQIKLKRKKLRS